MKLYELTADFRDFLEAIDNLEGGEILSDTVYADTLDALKIPFDEKVESIAKVIKTLQYESDALKQEKDRVNKLKVSRDKEIERLKAYMQANMEAVKIKKVKGATLSVNIQKNPPSVNIDDESLIPITYKVAQEPAIDKKAILVELKQENAVPGCSLKQTESVRIR
ncbi:siphovirus Gp157 family protein [Bacillus sp. Marseille-P3800]|uniref:siphovirus Gp157 family protein n=1 Tax=Bacillus sp. Marseille-P3800 TaxID=2014782 RepID=UPI000C06F0C2|nr:siphovirus Gp157 family protein [Bacillus sp. Marseille-P3800]